VWIPIAVLRRNAAAIAAGVLIAAASAGVAGAITSGAHWHSWSDVQAAVTGTAAEPVPAAAASTPAHTGASSASGITVAAAALAGVVATLALLLAMVIVSFSAFFLLGLPALLGLIAAGAVWGMQAGFGATAPLEPWLAGAGGVALLALALNTGAALPIYWSLVFGSGRRLDRLREAWSGYWTLFRGLVIPACALFGLVVFRLLAAG
jgi:hypothetical protein